VGALHKFLRNKKYLKKAMVFKRNRFVTLLVKMGTPAEELIVSGMRTGSLMVNKAFFYEYPKEYMECLDLSIKDIIKTDSTELIKFVLELLSSS